jgi:hypothetical protein
MIAPTARIHAAPSQASCAVGDGVAIFDSAGGRYFALDTVGAFVWDELPSSIAELAAAVAGEFAVDLPTAERDVAALVEQLLAAGLVDVKA